MSTYDAYLIKNKYTTDEIGQSVLAPEKRGIFCETKSIRQQEFYKAGTAGIKVARHILVTPKVNYDDEEFIEYGDNIYKIYRTYEIPSSDYIELYLEERGGLNVEEDSD